MSKLILITPVSESVIAENLSIDVADRVVKSYAATEGVSDIDAVYTDDDGTELEFDFDRGTFGPPD